MRRLSRRAAVMTLLATSLALPLSRRLRVGTATQGLLLVDESLGAADLAGSPALAGGQRTLAIRADLVRQWRAGLGRELAGESAPVTALLRWDKALLLSGLAREAGIPVASERLTRSLFRVDLNPIV